MQKSKIIIADKEISYVTPLCAYISDNLSDNFTLEVITDADYLNEHFSQMQKAEILIISEDFYSTTHNFQGIGHVFILCDNPPSGNTENLSIHRLNKYSSVKELFGEIIPFCSEMFNPHKEDESPKIILVCSGNGGTGKTTISTALAYSMTRKNKKVLYINAEKLQTFQCLLVNSAPLPYETCNLCMDASASSYNQIRYAFRNEGFDYMPPFRGSLMSQGINYSIFQNIALAAKNSQEYDYVIIDTDSTFDEEKATLHKIADKVLVVFESLEPSIYATNVLLSNLDSISSDKYIFICNKFSKEKNDTPSSVKTNFSIDMYVPDYEGTVIRIENVAKKRDVQKLAHLLM